MESRITVIGAELRSAYYANKAGGAPREVKSYNCKVILHLEGGAVDVGTLKVPEALAPEGVTPGDYLISYRAGRGYQDDKIVGVMVGFKGINSKGGKAVEIPGQPKQEASKPQ